MMAAERSALDLMTGTALTTCATDNARATAAIRAFGSEAVPVVLAKRRAWRDYLTVTQRRWQSHTRRQSRARHLDSLSIREKYVRCD